MKKLVDFVVSILFLILALIFSMQSVVAQDPVKVDSKHYKVEAENAWVRVLRINYGPKEKSVMHKHPAGMVVYLTDSEVKFGLPGGKSQELSGKAGEAAWIPAGTHLPENLGDKPIEAILVELKVKPPAAKSSAAEDPLKTDPQVYKAELGGPEDHAAQAKSMNDVRPIIDARMTATVRVTAGPHDVGFTFKDRPDQRQDVWVPSLRDSQEIHFTGGAPKLKTVGIEGPYKVTGVSATPSRERVFLCTPKTAAEEAPCANRILLNVARRAFRRPVTAADWHGQKTAAHNARPRPRCRRVRVDPLARVGSITRGSP